MSIRENIQLFHQLDIDEYLRVLKEKYGAREHPNQPDAYLVDDPGLPFYRPQWNEDHVFVLGFNKVPLSDRLVQALIGHPELAPDTTIVRWTQEQDLVMETTLGELRKQFRGAYEGGKKNP